MRQTCTVVVALCFAARTAATSHDHSRKTSGKEQGGIEKVIEMLAANRVKVISDLNAEELEMQAYSRFCDTETGAKTEAIKIATRKMQDLDATISDAVAQNKALEDEIATLGIEMAGKEKEIFNMEEVRKREKTDFAAKEKELIGAVDELDKTVVIMKRELSESFVQVGARRHLQRGPDSPEMQAVVRSLSSIVDASWLDEGSNSYLKGLLQQNLKDSSSAVEASEEAEDDDLRLTSKGKGKGEKEGGLLGTVIDMKERAEVTLSKVRESEMKAGFNFQMMKASLENAMGLSKKALAESTTTKSILLEDSGKAKGEMSETRKSKNADSAYLKSLTNECEEAARAWQERQASAKDEVAALDKAKEILVERAKAMLQFAGKEEEEGKGGLVGKDKDKTGAESGLEAGTAPFDDDQAAKVRSRLVGELKDLGHKFHSYAMMEMCSAAATDPFEKVRGLIEDMISKLIAEANEEAGQKQFCDEEKAKSNAVKDDKSMKLDGLQARLDKATARSAALVDKNKELQAELAEIEKSTAEATKMRNEEAANYAKASKDYKDSASAVEEAIGVLKDFYQNLLQGDVIADLQGNVTTDLLQKGSRAKGDAPDFGGAKADAGNGILALLEVCAEDFTRLLTEASSEEMTAKASYNQMVMESKVATVSKNAEMKGGESEVKQLAVAIRGYQEDHTYTSQELDAVMAYLDKLKPQCEVKVLSYEEKRAKRQAEIEGLKQALGILAGGSFLQEKHSLRGVFARA